MYSNTNSVSCNLIVNAITKQKTIKEQTVEQLLNFDDDKTPPTHNKQDNVKRRDEGILQSIPIKQFFIKCILLE